MLDGRRAILYRWRGLLGSERGVCGGLSGYTILLRSPLIRSLELYGRIAALGLAEKLVVFTTTAEGIERILDRLG